MIFVAFIPSYNFIHFREFACLLFIFCEFCLQSHSFRDCLCLSQSGCQWACPTCEGANDEVNHIERRLVICFNYKGNWISLRVQFTNPVEMVGHVFKHNLRTLGERQSTK